MAMTKITETDMLAEIAGELGITRAHLDSMSLDSIRDLIDSGDLDPERKVHLVRSRLAKAVDELDLIDGFLRDYAGKGRSRDLSFSGNMSG